MFRIPAAASVGSSRRGRGIGERRRSYWISRRMTISSGGIPAGRRACPLAQSSPIRCSLTAGMLSLAVWKGFKRECRRRVVREGSGGIHP